MSYFAVVIVFVIGALVGIVFVALSHLLGPRRPSPVKYGPYECGVDPRGSPLHRMNIKYYRVALLFILFDIETVFLIPWAVIYRNALSDWGLFIFVEMLVFIVVLAVGLGYVWKKGALEWE